MDKLIQDLRHAVRWLLRDPGFIRLALGAAAGDVLRLVLRQALRLSVVALAAGLAASLVLAPIAALRSE